MDRVLMELKLSDMREENEKLKAKLATFTEFLKDTAELIDRLPIYEDEDRYEISEWKKECYEVQDMLI